MYTMEEMVGSWLVWDNRVTDRPILLAIYESKEDAETYLRNLQNGATRWSANKI